MRSIQKMFLLLTLLIVCLATIEYTFQKGEKNEWGAGTIIFIFVFLNLFIAYGLKLEEREKNGDKKV